MLVQEYETKKRMVFNSIQLTEKNNENTIKNDNDIKATEETSTYSGYSTITSNSNPKRIGWTNLHYSLSNYDHNQSETMKNLVLLDSNSTNTIFCNEEYVTNIKKADIPLEIHTNGGTMMVTQKYKIPQQGTHLFNRNAITNIISLADISEIFRVIIDTQEKKHLSYAEDRPA